MLGRGVHHARGGRSVGHCAHVDSIAAGLGAQKVRRDRTNSLKTGIEMQRAMIAKCFLCERRLTVGRDRGWRNWVCDDCAGAHDLRRPLAEWPEWARKFCGAHERRDRRLEQQRIAAGVTFEPLTDEILGTCTDE